MEVFKVLFWAMVGVLTYIAFTWTWNLMEIL